MKIRWLLVFSMFASAAQSYTLEVSDTVESSLSLGGFTFKLSYNWGHLCDATNFGTFDVIGGSGFKTAQAYADIKDSDYPQGTPDSAYHYAGHGFQVPDCSYVTGDSADFHASYFLKSNDGRFGKYKIDSAQASGSHVKFFFRFDELHPAWSISVRKSDPGLSPAPRISRGPGSLTFSARLAETQDVVLMLYDARGRLLASRTYANQSPGPHAWELQSPHLEGSGSSILFLKSSILKQPMKIFFPAAP